MNVASLSLCEIILGRPTAKNTKRVWSQFCHKTKRKTSHFPISLSQAKRVNSPGLKVKNRKSPHPELPGVLARAEDTTSCSV